MLENSAPLGPTKGSHLHLVCYGRSGPLAPCLLWQEWSVVLERNILMDHFKENSSHVFTLMAVSTSLTPSQTNTCKYIETGTNR